MTDSVTEIQITQVLQLPVGLEIGGVNHREVEMRRVKGSDIIAIQNDARVIELSRKNLEMDGVNPIKAMLATAGMIEMFSILFSRVVVRVGSVTDKNKLTPSVFQSMWQEDIGAMMKHYGTMNGVSEEEMKEGVTQRPFGSSPTTLDNSRIH